MIPSSWISFNRCSSMHNPWGNVCVWLMSWSRAIYFFAAGSDSKVSDVDGQPYTTLLYSNGPGYTQPRNILREAGKDSIQVKRKIAGTFSRTGIYIAALFIGSENDRGGNIGGTFKDPSRFVNGFVREIFDGTLWNFIYPALYRDTSPPPFYSLIRVAVSKF